MAKKHVTIEGLARMIKKGFDETATKTQVFGLEKQADKVEGRLDKIEYRLDKIEGRLENIEKILLKQHGDQIQNLERRVKYLEELFAVTAK